MPRTPNALKRPAIYLGLVVALGWGVLSACTENLGGFDQITVTVVGSGTGAGNVSSNDPAVAIDCNFPTAVTCTDTFSDAGGGGQFNLIATPSTGSVLGAWTGCNSTSGTVCTLSFPANSGNTTFAVTARFDPASGANDMLQLYNGTAQPANLLIGSEVPSAANLLGPSGTRDVQIPTAIGTVVSVRAYVGGAQVANTTCTVTAAAWQGGNHPLAALFTEGAYILTCSNF